MYTDRMTILSFVLIIQSCLRSDILSVHLSLVAIELLSYQHVP